MQSLYNRRYAIAALLATVLLSAKPLYADDVKIKIPAPPMPKIVLPAPPPMIWLPTPQIHVAYDSPYPIFHQERHYYLHHDDNWYIGPSYNGPWGLIKGKQVPKSLRKFKKDNWGHYQREAAQRFRDDHDDRHHHHFYADRPQERATWDDYERRSRKDRHYHEHRDDHQRDKHEKRKEKHKKDKHDD